MDGDVAVFVRLFTARRRENNAFHGGRAIASLPVMSTARKVVRIRRVAPAQRLLDASDVDDMLDAFAVQDAEVVRVDVNVPEVKGPISGLMRKVDAPLAIDEIEELSDGISEGWEDDDDR